MSRSPITTHILDLGNGTPAADVFVTLDYLGEMPAGEPRRIAGAKTDSDGRIADWFSGAITAGHYRLTFATGPWYESRGETSFYPQICLDFRVTDITAHYHVPLLLNQWGYSTYRGS